MLLRRKGVISDLYIKLDQPWIRDLGVNTVLDIGANVGRFSKTIEHLMPQASIIAFEPLPSCFSEMNKLMGNCDRFRSYNVGLARESGELEMSENDHSPSSSFLEVGDLHLSAFPHAIEGPRRSVEIRRLDDLRDEIGIKGPLMIKVDVQGYELEVLAGGRETFAGADLLLIELSFDRLYNQQPVYDDMYQELRSLGFKFAGAISLMLHPATGRPLDADCLFVKAGS